MSLQDESIPVEPVNSPEAQEPAESTVEGKRVGQVKADQDVVVQDSMAGAVIAGQNSIVNDSVCGAVVAGGNFQATDSVGLVVVAGGNAEINNSKASLLLAGSSTVEQSTIGVLFAPQAALGKDVKVIMSARQALLFGVAFGLVAAILGRLLRRR
jgi:hypothetical protein